MIGTEVEPGVPVWEDNAEPGTPALTSTMEESAGAGREDCGPICGGNGGEETPSCLGTALDQ